MQVGVQRKERATSGSKLLNWPCDEALCANICASIKQSRRAATILGGLRCESGVFVEERSSREKKLRAVNDAPDAVSLFAICDSNPTIIDFKILPTPSKALN